MEIKTEFTHEWILTNRYFMKDNIQYVERTLSFDGDEEYRETGRSISNRGVLAELDKDMKDIVFSSNKCGGCRYKVGDYGGDVSYLLYLAFRSRIRLKLVKFKLYFLKVLKQNLFFKTKSAVIKKV